MANTELKEVRNLFMNIYGGTLKKIILDLDSQLEDECENRDFIKKTIIIAIDVYSEYYYVPDNLLKIFKKYK